MRNLILIATFASLITGCAVQKDMVPTGGSKADGIVKMSVDQRMFEAPKIDPYQALSAARRKCVAWGYTDAEAFEGSSRTCSEVSMGSCNAWTITVQYQCLGGK